MKAPRNATELINRLETVHESVMRGEVPEPGELVALDVIPEQLRATLIQSGGVANHAAAIAGALEDVMARATAELRELSSVRLRLDLTARNTGFTI